MRYLEEMTKLNCLLRWRVSTIMAVDQNSNFTDRSNFPAASPWFVAPWSKPRLSCFWSHLRKEGKRVRNPTRKGMFYGAAILRSSVFYLTSLGPLSLQASNFVPIYQIPGCGEITHGKTNILGKHLLLKILYIPPSPHHCVSPSWSRMGVVDWRGWTSAPTATERSESEVLAEARVGVAGWLALGKVAQRESHQIYPLPPWGVTSSSSNI